MKRFIQKLALFVILTLFYNSSSFASVDYLIESQTQALEQAIQLEQKGILKQKENGYLYLEVTRDFIAKTLPLIEIQGRIAPPKHYSSKRGIGAHISVIYENELIQNEIWAIQELGQSFPFKIKELRTIKLTKDGRIKKLWLLAVEAPELEKLRASYGLPHLLKGHDFHITLGTQMPRIVQIIEKLQEAA
jgi:hypothetical protein